MKSRPCRWLWFFAAFSLVSLSSLRPSFAADPSRQTFDHTYDADGHRLDRSPRQVKPRAEAVYLRSRFTRKYDDQIQDAVRRYWADWPFWRDYKAQLYQESTLDPSLCSGVGACGIAQFMPATWADITRQLGYGAINRHEAKYAIEAGAYYMAQLRRQWRAIDFPDRQRLGQASYNAGAGNIRKAQRLCGDPLSYSQIIACLASVTGPANARQTTDYVTRIAKWRAMMEAER